MKSDLAFNIEKIALATRAETSGYLIRLVDYVALTNRQLTVTEVPQNRVRSGTNDKENYV